MIFKPYKNVEVDNFEVVQKRKVATIESVEYLLNKYDKIYLIIGADNLKTLHLWHKYHKLKELVTFVVASRDDIAIPKNFLKIKVEEDISSTQLRENISEEKLSKICSDEIIDFLHNSYMSQRSKE